MVICQMIIYLSTDNWPIDNCTVISQYKILMTIFSVKILSNLKRVDLIQHIFFVIEVLIKNDIIYTGYIVFQNFHKTIYVF